MVGKVTSDGAHEDKLKSVTCDDPAKRAGRVSYGIDR